MVEVANVMNVKMVFLVRNAISSVQMGVRLV